MKMTLATLCSNSALVEEIEVCVKGVTRTSVEASRFLNLHLLRALEAGREVPRMDQTFFYRAFTAVAGATGTGAARDEFGVTLAEYTALRPGGLARFHAAGVTQMLNYAGKDYMTACQNHVVLNISRRVAKAFKAFFGGLDQNFRAPDRNKVCAHFMRCAERTSDVAATAGVWDGLVVRATHATRNAVEGYITRTLESYADLPLDSKGLGAVARVKTRWWAYLRWLHDLQKDAEARDGRRFSILPLCGFDAKYVTVDTNVLHGLLGRAAKRGAGPRPPPLAPFREHKREHWERNFRLSKVEGRNRRLDFEFMVLSDGYGASASMTRTKASVVPWQAAPAPDLIGKRVVSVDPGRRDLATCSTFGEDGVVTFPRFSNAEYREKIGSAKASTKRRTWLEGDGLEAVLELPTAKTSSSAVMRVHISRLLALIDPILLHHGARRVRSMRFTQYGRKQKVMEEICDRIVRGGVSDEDERPVIVAFGAGMFSSCSSGHCPGPVKGVRKALRRRGEEVHDVNEDYTSQLCCCCHKRVEPMYGADDSGAIHAVRRCLNTECSRTVWNRDVNAALNIHFVFVAEALHGARPVAFTRAYRTGLARAR